MVKVALSPGEQAAYEKYSDSLRRARSRLVDQYDVDPEPFGAFIKAVNGLTNSPDRGEQSAAHQYLSAFTKRRDLLAGCQAKLAAVTEVTEAIQSAERTLVFAQTVDAGEAITERLRSRGLAAVAISSQTPQTERARVLTAFGYGHYQVLTAPRILDEGIDVPAADLAVVVAASQSPIQMIQRMGRVLRTKGDKRLARLVIFCVEGTPEDPDTGGHEAFLDMILPVADEIGRFRPGQARHLCAFLNDFQARPGIQAI